MVHRSIRSSPRLVGRQREREWLETCWREATDGRPRVVLIAGEPGIGKSRLIHELRALVARSRKAAVCTGRAYEDVALPYLPLAEALRARLARLAARSDLGHELEALLRLRAEPRAVPEPHLAGADAERYAEQGQFFRAASRGLVELARMEPVCLLLDDLHWADGPSIELIRHLIFALADAESDGTVPFLLVCGYRPAEKASSLDRMLSRVRQEPICSQVELDRLNDAEVLDLLRALGISRPSPRLVAAVNGTARGNPLFVQELLHHLDRRGLLCERRGTLDLASRELPLQLPPTLEQAIAWRTRDLGEACRAALTLAACLGDRFRVEDLRELREDTPPLADLLEVAVRQGVLCADGDRFEFAHPLLRGAIYGQASPATRRQMHLQIADTLERRKDHDVHLLEIAHHLVLAGDAADTERLRACAQRAGERALALSANADAARNFEAALAADAALGGGDLRARAALHHIAGVAYFRSSEAARCLEHFEAAARDYRALGDRRGLAHALMGVARVRVTIDPLPYGTLADVAELQAVTEALGTEDLGLRGRIFAVLSQVRWVARQPKEAVAMAREALAIGRATGDDWLCSEACDALALAESQTSRVRDAAASQRLAGDYASKCGDGWIRVQSVRRLPLVLAWLGELEDSERWARWLTEEGTGADDGSARSMALAALAAIAVSRGRFEDVDASAREALLASRRSGNPWGAFNALLAQACAHTLRGAWLEAQRTLAELAEPGALFEEPGAPIRLLAWLHHQLVDVRARPNAGSRDALVSGLAKVLPQGEVEVGALAGLCAVVEIADLLGKPELVLPPYRVLRQAAERGVLFTSAWPSLVPRVLGVAAALLGEWADAETHFDEALDAARRLALPADEARVHLDKARMLARRGGAGDEERAGRHLALGVPLLERLGLRGFQRETEALVQQIGRERAVEAERKGTGLDADDARLLTSLADGPPRPSHALDARVSRALARLAASGGPNDIVPSHEGPLVLLLTDMVGSTELIDRLGDRSAREVMRVHNALLRESLREHGGREIEHTGDGILASFAMPIRALECAVAIQRSVARHNERAGAVPIRVRVALAAGEALSDEGGRLFGAVVNTVARICALVQPDEILVSGLATLLAGGNSLTLEDRGHVRLKGFARSFPLQAVRW